MDVMQVLFAAAMGKLRGAGQRGLKGASFLISCSINCVLLAIVFTHDVLLSPQGMTFSTLPYRQLSSNSYRLHKIRLLKPAT